MRPSFLVSFLILSILISEVQGIRLNKGILPAQLHKIHKGTTVDRASNEAVGEATIICKGGHCSGNYRKLMTHVTTNPTTNTNSNSKSDKNGGTTFTSNGKSNTEGFGGKEESFSINASPVSKHQEAAAGHFPDILDIAEMDYSPAKRKPPIHN